MKKSYSTPALSRLTYETERLMDVSMVANKGISGDQVLTRDKEDFTSGAAWDDAEWE